MNSGRTILQVNQPPLPLMRICPVRSLLPTVAGAAYERGVFFATNLAVPGPSIGGSMNPLRAPGTHSFRGLRKEHTVPIADRS